MDSEREQREQPLQLFLLVVRYADYAGVFWFVFINNEYLRGLIWCILMFAIGVVGIVLDGLITYWTRPRITS